MSTKTKFGRERSWAADAGGGFGRAAPGDVQPAAATMASRTPATAPPNFLVITLPSSNPARPSRRSRELARSARTQEWYLARQRHYSPAAPAGMLPLRLANATLTQLIGCHNMATNQLLH